MGNLLSFQSAGKVNNKTIFEVIGFEGHEAISENYEFKIRLRSTDNLKSNNFLNQHGILSIEIDNNTSYTYAQTSKYHGIILEFINKEKVLEHYHYEITLASKLSQLKYSHKSDIFVDSCLNEILKKVFQEESFPTNQLKINFNLDDKFYKSNKDIYSRYSYVCQFEESNYALISRLLQRDGLSYYFKQDIDHEQLIITDGNFDLIRDKTLCFEFISQQSTSINPNAINSIQCKHTVIPGKVTIKNFGYEKSHLGDNGVISCSIKISPSNNEDSNLFTGEKVIYGEPFVDPDNNGDGEFLARIRAEEIYCRSMVYTAKSTAVPIYAGMIVTIDDKKIQEFNGKYLVVEVSHSGYQQLDSKTTSENSPPFYENTLVLIPADRKFRPERKTPWPRIYGTINALIDSEKNDRTLPDIDDQGRYLVRMLFLKNRKANGKGSIRLRLASPYAGHQFGFHFPLSPGTEVIIFFIDGDPDKPIIGAALFNSSHENVVIRENAHLGGILLSRGGNAFIMSDSKDATSISMTTNNNWQILQ